jgi:hypothetical protein
MGAHLAGEHGLGIAARCNHCAAAVGCDHRCAQMVAVDPVNDRIIARIPGSNRKQAIAAHPVIAAKG